MPAPGPVLKEAHRLRQHIQDLETRIAQAPRQLQLQKNKLQMAEDNLKAAQDAIKLLKVKINEREGASKATYQQVAKWEKQRDGVENKKEFEALTHELSQAQEKIQALEDEIFAAMAELDEKVAQLPTVEAATKQVRADVAKYESDYEARLAKLAGERDVALAELQTVDAQIPEDIAVIYTKLVKLKGADALAKIEGRSCTACYTELTPQNAGEILRGIFVICKSCGRMLYG